MIGALHARLNGKVCAMAADGGAAQDRAWMARRGPDGPSERRRKAHRLEPGQARQGGAATESFRNEMVRLAQRRQPERLALQGE